MRRYLRRTPAGLLRIDAAAVKREQHLDGKWLLRTSDTTLSADDLAAAYKQLLQVERGWRDMKGHLALRPVFHYREDRIRAHVQLCWLALLLIRVVENGTGNTWRNTRHELDRMHLVTLATTDGHLAQRTATTPAAQGDPGRPRPPRATQSLRLHPTQRLTTTSDPEACSNTTPVPPARLLAGQQADQRRRVPTICGSPVRTRAAIPTARTRTEPSAAAAASSVPA